jgi:hypothetical protein
MAWWIYEKSDGSFKSDNVLDVKSQAVAKEGNLNTTEKDARQQL